MGVNENWMLMPNFNQSVQSRMLGWQMPHDDRVVIGV